MLPERFIAKFQEDDATGCWVWNAYRNPAGYGMLQMRQRSNKPILAHRLSYEVLVGPIPDGLVIDHLCRNRACVNPAHMEPVTRAVNTERGDMRNRGIRNREKTHCIKGHPFDQANTVYPDRKRPTKRVCRLCRNAHAREHYWRTHAA